MTQRWTLVATLVGLLVVPAASADWIVTVPGPLSSFDISTRITSMDPLPVLEATYDLTGTRSDAGPPLVIDAPPFAIFPPPGGTATYLGADPSRMTFRFGYTGFTTGLLSDFGWDPDIAGDPFYGGAVMELIGMRVTLLTPAGLTLPGILDVDPVGFGLRAVIPSPAPAGVVPEPSSGVLLAAGLALGVAARASRRRS